jgi:hypothetical protein
MVGAVSMNTPLDAMPCPLEPRRQCGDARSFTARSCGAPFGGAQPTVAKALPEQCKTCEKAVEGLPANAWTSGGKPFPSRQIARHGP